MCDKKYEGISGGGQNAKFKIETLKEGKLMRRFSLVMLVVAVLLALVVPASSAQGGGIYVRSGEAPVPEGQVVNVLYRSGHEFSFEWKERIQDGFYFHTYVLNVQAVCFSGSRDASCESSQARILRWMDLQNNVGRYQPDGVIDLALIAPVDYQLQNVVPYFTPGGAPISIGEMVEIKRPDYLKGQGLIEVYWTTWDSGYCTILPESKLLFERFDPGPPAHYFETYPVDGVFGVVKDFWDTPSGDEFKTDGLVDKIVIHEARTWSSFEVDVLHAQLDYEADLQARNLALIDTASEAEVSYYDIDGERAELGPWGLTFKVNQNGSEVTAIHETPEAWIGWKTDGVVPGMYVRNGALSWVSQMLPEDFLWEVGQRSLPQWQWETSLIGQYGTGIYASDDERTVAVLARLGFGRVGWQQEDRFCFYTQLGPNEVQLPPHTTKAVSDLEVQLDDFAMKFTPVYCQSCWQPAGILSYGEPKQDGSNTIFVGSGQLIVVVPNNKTLSEFRWQDFQVFELVRSGWREVVLHQIVWPKAK